MGKSLLNYKWSFGAATIMLTKVLLRYIAKESSAFQISARGKIDFIIALAILYNQLVS